MAPFSQRIELICRELGTIPSKLSLAAGLSVETVPKMLQQAEKTGEIPGTGATLFKLAKHVDVSLDWLVDVEPVEPGAAVPFGSFQKGKR